MPDPVTLFELWLPILVSAIAVFFLAFLTHMVLPHHKADFKPFPKRQELMDFVKADVEPGQYMIPTGDWAELKDPEKLKWYEAGPHGMLRVWSGMPNMGRNLGLTFACYVLMSLFVAYLATQAIDAGIGFRPAFRFTGTAAVMAYCLGPLPGAIWYRPPSRAVLNELLDGVLFGLATGLSFAWLWPSQQVLPM